MPGAVALTEPIAFARRVGVRRGVGVPECARCTPERVAGRERLGLAEPELNRRRA